MAFEQIRFKKWKLGRYDSVNLILFVCESLQVGPQEISLLTSLSLNI